MTGPGVLIVFYLNFFLLCGVALRHWFKFIAQVRSPATTIGLSFQSHCRSASHGTKRIRDGAGADADVMPQLSRGL